MVPAFFHQQSGCYPEAPCQCLCLAPEAHALIAWPISLHHHIPSTGRPATAFQCPNQNGSCQIPAKEISHAGLACQSYALCGAPITALRCRCVVFPLSGPGIFQLHLQDQLTTSRSAVPGSQSGHAPINPLATCGLDPSQFDSSARALALHPGYLSTATYLQCFAIGGHLLTLVSAAYHQTKQDIPTHSVMSRALIHAYLCDLPNPQSIRPQPRAGPGFVVSLALVWQLVTARFSDVYRRWLHLFWGRNRARRTSLTILCDQCTGICLNHLLILFRTLSSLVQVSGTH